MNEKELLKTSPSFRQTDYDEETLDKIEFGEECGLKFTGEINDDGEPVFLGNNKSWDKFNKGI